jgi:hypothetical protein
MTTTSILQAPVDKSGHLRRAIAVLVVLAVIAVAFVVGRVTVHATHTTRTVTVTAPSQSTPDYCLVHRTIC